MVTGRNRGFGVRFTGGGSRPVRGLRRCLSLLYPVRVGDGERDRHTGPRPTSRVDSELDGEILYPIYRGEVSHRHF